MTREDDAIFEDEVRRIARLLWPEAQYSGAGKEEGREHDGEFITDDCVHLLEATTSRKKDKAETDIRKLVSSAQKRQRQYPTRAVKCWFVTRDEPTADQRSVANRYAGLVCAMSFSQFQSRLIDARSYLGARENYPFGSVRDPNDWTRINPSTEYVPPNLMERRSGELWDVERIGDALLKGKRVVLLGDYGVGKSMTMREVYRYLKRKHLTNVTPLFPVYINLRDHHGQIDPAEVLERHARNVGFANPSHLVRAWHAGYAILLLDGFDEMTTFGWAAAWRRLRDARYRSMEVIRKFGLGTREGPGLALAGRAHFFDSTAERERALGLPSTYVELQLDNFGEEQVAIYLEKSGFKGSIPHWFPSRPLLLGYLMAKGLLQEVYDLDAIAEGVLDPVAGWNRLIQRIAEREALIEVGIDGETVRRVLERIATKARASQDGLGPLSAQQLIEAFEEICLYPPDDQGMVLLQRLPGLGVYREEEESRQFIDQDLADVCRAGDVVEFIKDPFSFNVDPFYGAECCLHPLGIGVVSARLEAMGCSGGSINPALRQAIECEAPPALVADLVLLAMENGCSLTSRVCVNGVQIDTIDLTLEAGDLSKVEFRDCSVGRLEIEGEVEESKLPHFRSCWFTEVDGRASEQDLPEGLFEDCVFDSFVRTTETTHGILAYQEIPLGTRVALTILRKIFLQRGTGRRENALYRGLDSSARRLVPEVLRLLQSAGLVTRYPRKGGAIWLPVRSQNVRVHRLIQSPLIGSDPLLSKTASLQP